MTLDLLKALVYALTMRAGGQVVLTADELTTESDECLRLFYQEGEGGPALIVTAISPQRFDEFKAMSGTKEW